MQITDTIADMLTSVRRRLKVAIEEKAYTKALEISIEMAEIITQEELKDVVPVVKKEFTRRLNAINGALKELNFEV